MKEALYEGDYFDLQVYLEAQLDKKAEIIKLKKRATKGAFRCPYCSETLILKSGEHREEHFSHRHSKACEISNASEVYQRQVQRESRRHSVMKDIIYDALKSQEKLTENLQVEYGYISKAIEKWKYYPDIVVRNKGKEIAITILTDVIPSQDRRLVKQIQKRNLYFQGKNLVPIWFVENTEQSVDMERRVIHLWEAELNLAIQTDEDAEWEAMINGLSLKASLFKLFSYHHQSQPTNYDVRSLYFIHSTETNIVFTVQRFIIDETEYPYRAFALNDAYEISLSTALQTRNMIQLSDPNIDVQQRSDFLKLVKQKEEEFIVKEQERKQLKSEVTATIDSAKKLSVPELELANFPNEIISYAQVNEEFSAMEISEYLVSECGASSETYRTGRYKIYSSVCECLESLAEEGYLLFVKRDYVSDQFYKRAFEE